MSPAVAAPPIRVDPQPSLSEAVVTLRILQTSSQGTTTTSVRTVQPRASLPMRVMTSVWFESVRDQFESAISLPRGWDTYQGVPSSLSSVERAFSFLGTYLQRESLPPTVVPLSDGGIQLVWHQNGLDVEATFSTTDDGEVYVRDIADGTEAEFGLASAGEGPTVLREAFQRLTA